MCVTRGRMVDVNINVRRKEIVPSVLATKVVNWQKTRSPVRKVGVIFFQLTECHQLSSVVA